jgi:hypothetical protein
LPYVCHTYDHGRASKRVTVFSLQHITGRELRQMK